MDRAFDAAQIDSVQEHRQLSRIELNVLLSRGVERAEAASLEALVPKHEATALEREDLGPVAAGREENEEVSAEEVLASGTNDRTETIEALAHVDRRDEKANADRRREPDHGARPLTPRSTEEM